MTTLEQFQAIVREHLGDESIVITRDTQLTDDMGVDSYDLAIIVAEVEQHFDIDVDYQAAMQLQNAGDVVRYIEQSM